MGHDTAGTERPRLSVTVLNYNYARFLPKCLDSILAQSFTDFEVIVIDDRSKDDSLAVLEPYRRYPRVRVVAHEVNRGYVSSLIEGTELCSRGDYVTVISADDLVRDPDAFRRQIALMEGNPGTAFCFSAFDRFWTDNGTLIERQRSYSADRIVPGQEFLWSFLTDVRIQVLHSGVIIRRSAYEAAGGYRRDVRYAVDFWMWLLLSLEGEIAYCATPLYGYGVHRLQMSSSAAGVRSTLLEVLGAIDVACARASARGIETTQLRRQAVRRSLAAVALDDVFSGRRRLALTRAWVAFRARPLDTVLARGIWIVLLRALLGRRGFAWARRRLAGQPAAL